LPVLPVLVRFSGLTSRAPPLRRWRYCSRRRLSVLRFLWRPRERSRGHFLLSGFLPTAVADEPRARGNRGSRAGLLAFCRTPRHAVAGRSTTDFLATASRRAGTRPCRSPCSPRFSLQAVPFDDHKTCRFSTDLLPEGRMRRLIARRFHVFDGNGFRFSAYKGWDPSRLGGAPPPTPS
jgi:hypothetical protein